jgi:AraC-like DNA-binding protein
MQKIAISSDEFPAQIDDRARYSLWRDLFAARFGRLDLSRPDDTRFSARFEFSQFGSVGLGQFVGTVKRVARTSHHIATDRCSDICLALNGGRSPMTSAHRGREHVLAPGLATLYSDCDVAETRSGASENTLLFVTLPRRHLMEFVAEAEDLAGAQLDHARPAVQYLRRYLDILLEFDGIGDDPVLGAHIGTTLFDLAALALGATREAAEVARARGLRAARLQEIFVAIRRGFADPVFTVEALASRLGLSQRHVQDLLHETGATFTERVLELRLQKARAMLTDRRHDSLRVIDIAISCGFDSVSYFNRCFRRRFGASPTQYRGNGDAAD